MDAKAMTAAALRAQKAAALRYKRPALESMGYETILAELQDIYDICEEMRWSDEPTSPAMDGDGDEDLGYQEEFGALSDDAYRLMEQLQDSDYDAEGYDGMFDTCTVGLIGDRFETVGYDTVETDYFHLCGYEQELAQRDSAKRLMRLTKADMITTIGHCVGVMMAFYDLRQRFDYLNTALNVTLGHNLDTLHKVRTIEDAYDAWCEDGCRNWGDTHRKLDSACQNLPDMMWVC